MRLQFRASQRQPTADSGFGWRLSDRRDVLGDLMMSDDLLMGIIQPLLQQILFGLPLRSSIR